MGYVESDGVLQMPNGLRLKPFIAAHHNDMINDGDLNKSLRRIVLVLHKKKDSASQTVLKINNRLIPLICSKNRKQNKLKFIKFETEISSSEEAEIRKALYCQTTNGQRSRSVTMSRKRHRNKGRKRKRLSFESGIKREYDGTTADDSEDEVIMHSDRSNAYCQRLQRQNDSQSRRINNLQRRINDLQRRNVILESEKNAASAVKVEKCKEIKLENVGQMNAMRMEIQSLQSEIATLYQNQNGYGQLHLRDQIKILKNDNERLAAINKNDQITFHQQMFAYQTRIAQELQQIIAKNKAQKEESDKRMRQCVEEKDYYRNQCLAQGWMKRRKLNNCEKY